MFGIDPKTIAVTASGTPELTGATRVRHRMTEEELDRAIQAASKSGSGNNRQDCNSTSNSGNCMNEASCDGSSNGGRCFNLGSCQADSEIAQ